MFCNNFYIILMRWTKVKELFFLSKHSRHSKFIHASPIFNSELVCTFYVDWNSTNGLAAWRPLPYPIIHVKSLQLTQKSGIIYRYPIFNTLRLRQNGWHFPDDIFKCIFLNKNVQISIKILLKFVPSHGPINNIPSLVQIMACHQPGDKPLSEPMMA